MGGMEIFPHSFLIAALVEFSGEINVPVTLPVGKEPKVCIEWETRLALEPICMVRRRDISLDYARNSNNDGLVIQYVV
jgi:hypothetical protein